MFHEIISNPNYFTLLLFLISILGGLLGAILGLGGGIIIVPTLTLLFGIDIRYAIGASIVSVIATSSGAAAAYVRDRMANIRVAMFLEIATTAGAITGALLAAQLASKYLFLLFSIILIYSALSMFRKRKLEGARHPHQVKSDPLSKTLRLSSSYPDASLGREVVYSVGGVKLGFVLMYAAGVMSALLGIGSGVLKVPAMDGAMGLPIKVSTATSNFMIGVTAAASAGAYYMRGDILPMIAAPVALGVFFGSWVGIRLLTKLPARSIRSLFIFVLVIVAVQMGLKGLKSGAH